MKNKVAMNRPPTANTSISQNFQAALGDTRSGRLAGSKAETWPAGEPAHMLRSGWRVPSVRVDWPSRCAQSPRPVLPSSTT